MGLRLDEHWILDQWTDRDGPRTHVFYLQASRTLGDPDLRHDHTSVGHAVSEDLRQWTILEDAFEPGAPGTFDDRAIWTGSVLRVGDTWHLAYTGRTNADAGAVQRIAMATSPDLARFTRVPGGPHLEADPRWYESAGAFDWHEVAWRDPWLLADPGGDGYHALITARRRDGPPATRGVLGHATSPDLRRWTVHPPLPSPAGFGQLEVPQVVTIDGRTYLVFCVLAPEMAAERRAQDPLGAGGTYIIRAPSPLGPFHLPLEAPLAPYSRLYAGRLLEHGGRWWFGGFIDRPEGEFVGAHADLEPFDPSRVTATTGAPPGVG